MTWRNVVVDVNDLYRACGYPVHTPDQQPTAPAVDRAKEALAEIPDMQTRVEVFLNGSSDLPDFAKEQIRQMVLDAWEKSKAEDDKP